MKTLKTIISEKFEINKNTKISYNIDINNLVNEVLGPWLFDKDTYKGTKNRRFEFLRYFNDNIIELINFFDKTEFLANKANIDINIFTQFINDNNDELYKKCKIFYQDIFDEIKF